MARRSDSRWLVRSSAIALSFGCIAIGAMERGSAQSFNGTPNVVAGQVDQFLTGSGTTDILINGATPQVVIDWTPSDTTAGPGAIAFQNAGTTATFSRIGGSDFAVLNRILPAGAAAGRSVLLDGSIQGRVSTGTPGGRIYFYTPNGLIIGSNAQIDVGALGLTTSNIQYTTGFGGSFITGTGSDTVTFTGANAGSSVTILPGAQINATQLNLNNYVAILAPYIEQGGTINVNGSTALIAAEAGTMTWSNGLFDVQVTTGTDGDASHRAIFHVGSTGGPASGGGPDLHRIYTVAVPKNTAITTLIASGSSLGFDVAGAADVIGNGVILTAGYDIVGGSIVPSSGAGGAVAGVQVTNSTVTSDLSIVATGVATVEAVGGGLSGLASNLFVGSPIQALVQAAGAASSLTIGGDLFLSASRAGSAGSVDGGNAILAASGGASMVIVGSASLNASAISGAGGTSTGGLAQVRVETGGSLNVNSDLTIESLGSINQTEFGNAIGGVTEFLITGSGSVATISGDLDMDTAGLGGGVDADLPDGVSGGDGTGGTSRILADGVGARLTVVGTVNVEANGRGGDGNIAASGNGIGGTASIDARSGGVIDLRSDALIEASATSGSVAYGTGTVIASATSGGNATGGQAALTTGGTGSIISVDGDLTIEALATSDGTAASGAAGGLARGINAVNGGAVSATITAGDGIIDVNGATVVDVTGRGGSGNANHSGTGGNIIVSAIGLGTLEINGDFDLIADGIGADALIDNSGGAGVGGFVRLTTSGVASSITIDSPAGAVGLSAEGIGGAALGAGAGGTGTGGLAQIEAVEGDITTNALVRLSATAHGGDSIDGNAGAAYGGIAGIVSQAGAVLTLNDPAAAPSLPVVILEASGEGGFASGQGNGGDASAGIVQVLAFNGGQTVVDGGATLFALSVGGDGANGGDGNGLLNPVFGGPAETVIGGSGGLVTVNGATQMIVSGSGGDALVAGGSGGDGSGGSISVFSNGEGGAADVTLNSLTAFASAQGGTGATGVVGGSGGAGGSATAGAIGIGGSADNGDLVTADVLTSVSALGGSGGDGGDSPSGAGGSGGMGGNALGGAVLMGVFDSATSGAAGSATFGVVSVQAVATAGSGGNGGTGQTLNGSGGTGGSARAAAIGTAPSAFPIDGPSQILARGGSVVMSQYNLTANAFGGAGGSGPVTVFGQGGNAVAGGFDINVRAGGASGLAGSLVVGNATADLLALAGGAGGAEFFGSGPRITIADGTATFLSLAVSQQGDQPIALPVPQIGELTVVNGALIVDSLSILTSGPMSVFLNNGSVFSDTISLSAGAFVANPAGLVPVNPGVLNGIDSVSITSGNGIFLDASISSDSDISLTAPGSVHTFDLFTDGEVFVGAGGSIAVRNVIAGFDVDLVASGGPLSFGTVTAGGDANLSATGNISGTSIDAGDSVVVESGGTIVLGGEVTAGYFNPSSATGAEYSIGLLASGNISYGNIAALNQVGIGSLNGSVSGGQITGGSDVLILARTGVNIAGIESTGGPNSFVYIADSSMFALSPSIDPFDPAPLLAAAPVALAGPLTVGEVLGGNFLFAAEGSASLGNVDVEGDIFGRAGQILGGDIAAVGGVRLESPGLIGALTFTSSLGDVELLSGATVLANRIAAQGSVAVQAANDIILFTDGVDTNVTPGEVTAGRSVRLVAQSGSIIEDTSGNIVVNPRARIAAGSEILLLAGDRVNLGTLASSSGAVYVANSSMAALGGTFDNFQIGNLLEVAPTAVGGSILLRQASGPAFIAASEGPFTIGSVTASQFVFMRSQTGLLSISGTVQGRDVIVASADIDIGVGGAITGLSQGVVTLGSLNSTGAVIGDGATGGGYRLSAAELARISGDSVEIFGLDVAGLPIDMVIGNLSVTGPLAGSTIEATSGELSFTTGIPRAQTPGGRPVPSGGIRITGALAARGFTPTNQLGFFTGTLQLDANTGLIEILGQGTQLAGEIVLGAERFHAADATILDRLLENPLYADRIDNINTPLAVSRPGGILRADGLETESLSQFLIQNTGTRDLPAGVVVVSEGPIEFDFGPSPGSLEYVVNGQTITDSGTLTGTQVFDFLINDDNRGLFAPGSTVNGCLISDTACSIKPNVTEMDTEFLPADSLTHFTEEPARDEQVIDPEEREEAEEESKRAPIPPPTPIISTQPLAPVIDVDEPVAGAGNPGLISSALVPAGQGRETAQ